MNAPHAYPPSPPEPGPRRGVPRSTGTAVLAGTAVALVVGTVVVLGLVSDGDGDDDRKAAGSGQSSRPVPADWTARTADHLTRLPALRYTGTFTSAGTPIKAQFWVTKAGSATGSLTRAGQRADLVAVNGQTYLKGSAAFWKSAGGTTARPEDFAGRWAKAPATLLGFDIKEYLAPASIARSLRAARTPLRADDIGGRPAHQVSTPQGTYFGAAAAPYGLLLVQGASDSRFTVTEQADAKKMFAQLRGQVAALGGARDPGIQFQAGTLRFSNCNENIYGCTLSLPVSSQTPVVAEGSGGQTPSPQRAVLLASITAAGRTLGTCTTTQPLVRASTTLTCTVTSAGWQVWMRKARDVPGRHEYSAQARVVAEAVPATGVPALLAAVDRERTAG